VWDVQADLPCEQAMFLLQGPVIVIVRLKRKDLSRKRSESGWPM